jgi:hypothetical protein
MSKLKIEKNYCHCIQQIKTKNPKINPYAICTDSVYGSRNKIRDKIVNCDKHYNWTNMTVKELREHAKSKNLKITKNGKYIKKKILIKLIKIFK